MFSDVQSFQTPEFLNSGNLMRYQVFNNKFFTTHLFDVSVITFLQLYYISRDTAEADSLFAVLNAFNFYQ